MLRAVRQTQSVYGLVTLGVAAFQENGGGVACCQCGAQTCGVCLRRQAACVRRLCGRGGKEPHGLGDVRRDECAEGEEVGLYVLYAVVGHERRAAGGHHDGVADDGEGTVGLSPLFDVFYDEACCTDVGQHAYFYAVHTNVAVYAVQLGAQHIVGYGHDALYAHGVLCRESSGDGDSVVAHGTDGLQVLLYACPGGGVAAGYGQHHLHGNLFVIMLGFLLFVSNTGYAAPCVAQYHAAAEAHSLHFGEAREGHASKSHDLVVDEAFPGGAAELFCGEGGTVALL